MQRNLSAGVVAGSYRTTFSDSDLAGWDGFGMAVQAYQKRALAGCRMGA